MKAGFDNDEQLHEAQENCVRFFDDYDRRRGRDFQKSFPEFGPLINKWRVDHNV